MKSIFLPLLSALVFLFLTACTEPIIVGSDLLEDDRASVGQTTDIPFVTAVVRDDSLPTYEGPSFNLFTNYSVGRLEDPYFGNSTQGVYYVPVVPRTQGTGLPDPPQFAGVPNREADSIVLILPIDTANLFYGPGRELPFRLNLLSSRVPIGDGTEYTTADRQFEGFLDVNATNTVTPSPNPRINFDTIYAGSDTLPHLRIRLSQQYVDNFNARDRASFESDSAFATVLPGVFLEPTAPTNGLFGLRIPDNVPADPDISGFYTFYRDTTTNQTARIYRIPIRAVLPTVERSYTGTPVADLLDTPPDPERVVVQGQAGLMTAITFTDLSELDEKVINQAELTFYRETPEGVDYDAFPAPARLGLYYVSLRSGNLVPIADAQLLRNGAVDEIRDLFLGGVEERDEDDRPFYRVRFSVHLQEMIEGTVPRTMYLRVADLDGDPSRAVLAGPGAAVRPATIKAVFTEVDN